MDGATTIIVHLVSLQNFEAYNPEQKLGPGETPSGRNTSGCVLFKQRRADRILSWKLLGERNYLYYSAGGMRGY